jgi:hypothetical protein
MRFNHTDSSRIVVKSTISEDLSGKEDHNVTKLQYLQKKNEKFTGLHTCYNISLSSRSQQRNHSLSRNLGREGLSRTGLTQSRKSGELLFQELQDGQNLVYQFQLRILEQQRGQGQILDMSPDMSPELLKEMDRTPFPHSIITMDTGPNMIPKTIQTWGQLKAWIVQNPKSLGNIDLDILLDLPTWNL